MKIMQQESYTICQSTVPAPRGISYTASAPFYSSACCLPVKPQLASVLTQPVAFEVQLTELAVQRLDAELPLVPLAGPLFAVPLVAAFVVTQVVRPPISHLLSSGPQLVGLVVQAKLVPSIVLKLTVRLLPWQLLAHAIAPKLL